MQPYVVPWMDEDLETFRDTVVRFVETEMVPHDARWRAQHHVAKRTIRGHLKFARSDPSQQPA